MLVSELINSLKTKDPNAVVVISSDEEGNRYGVLYAIDAPMFFARYTGSRGVGDVFEVCEKDDISNMYGEILPCIILVPM